MPWLLSSTQRCSNSYRRKEKYVRKPTGESDYLVAMQTQRGHQREGGGGVWLRCEPRLSAFPLGFAFAFWGFFLFLFAVFFFGAFTCFMLTITMTLSYIVKRRITFAEPLRNHPKCLVSNAAEQPHTIGGCKGWRHRRICLPNIDPTTHDYGPDLA